MATIRTDAVLEERYVVHRRTREESGRTVWEASDTQGERRLVDVHVLSASGLANPLTRARYRLELSAIVWPWLAHANAAHVLRYVQDWATSYVVTEHIEGETLAERVAREGGLEAAEASRIAVVVADAVQAIHDLGVAHGDLSSSRVVLTPEGDVKVVDVGLTAAWRIAVAEKFGDSSWKQTPREDISRAVRVEQRRADVRGLGWMLFEMLVGSAPTRTDDDLDRIQHTLQRLRPDVPDALVAICLDAIGCRNREETGLARPLATRLAGVISALSEEPLPVQHEEPIPVHFEAPTSLPHARPKRLQPTARTPKGDVKARRVLLPAVAALIVLIAGVAAFSALGSPSSLPPKPETSSSRPVPVVDAPDGTSVEEPDAVAVPPVAGLSVAAAQEGLREAGLRLAEVRPVLGSPGIVVRTQPEAGQSVEAGSSVVLLVGVPPERLEADR